MTGLAEQQPLVDEVKMLTTPTLSIIYKSCFTKLTSLTNLTKHIQFFSFPVLQGGGSFLISTPIFLI